MTTEESADQHAHLRVVMLGKGWFPAVVGGLDRYFRDLLLALPDVGVSAVVVGPTGADAPGRVRTVSDQDARLWKRVLAFTRASLSEARRPSVVDAHFALYALLPVLALRRRRAIVVHFHGPWADESVLQGGTSRLAFLAKRAVERLVYRRADRVIVLSEAFARVVTERYGVSSDRVRVIPPGVDLDRFTPDAPEDRRTSEGTFRVVCVRRLVPRMGLTTLIDAWPAVLADCPGATLTIVGDGELATELASTTSARGLDESVRFPGRVSEGDLVRYYRSADCAVVPTTAEEGFGLVVLEAAGCGTPSVVTRVGGLEEAGAAFDDSLVVPPADPGALAERLVAVARGERPSGERLAEVVTRFGWPAVADRHDAIYREAVIAHRRSSA